MNANNIFSLVSRTQSLLDHPSIKRNNLGFALVRPFSWSLINSAAVFAQLSPEDKISERGDTLKIKMATLRHFNRQVGDNDIGMGAINACLKPDEKEISLEQIKQVARDRVKVERLNGRLLPKDVKVRYTKLYLDMYEDAKARKRALAALMDDVFFLCNSSDTTIDGVNHEDADLADYDTYGYMLEGLLDKCVQPVIRAKDEIQRVADKSYRTEAITTANLLMLECEKLGQELGINWAKMEAEKAKIEAELLAAEAVEAAEDADIDSVLDEADKEFSESLTDEVAPVTQRRTLIKSPERIEREQQETAAAAEKAAYAEKMAARAAKAKATREAKKVTSMRDIKQLVA